MSATYAACNSYSNVTLVPGTILTAMNSGRGWHSQFFWWGPRTAASDENVSPPTTGLQKAQWCWGVSQNYLPGMFYYYFSSEETDCRYSKACLQKTSCKYSKIWLLKANIKSYLTPEVDPTLKPSNWYVTTVRKLHMFSGQKSKCPRRFFGDGRWNLAQVFYEPLAQPVTNGFFFVFVCSFCLIFAF